MNFQDFPGPVIFNKRNPGLSRRRGNPDLTAHIYTHVRCTRQSHDYKLLTSIRMKRLLESDTGTQFYPIPRYLADNDPSHPVPQLLSHLQNFENHNSFQFNSVLIFALHVGVLFYRENTLRRRVCVCRYEHDLWPVLTFYQYCSSLFFAAFSYSRGRE